MNARQRRVARRRGDYVAYDGRRARQQAYDDMCLAFHARFNRWPENRYDEAVGARLLLASMNPTDDDLAFLWGFPLSSPI